MKIVIAGDTVPSARNTGLFESGNIRKLMGESLEKRILSADIFILNLEAPLINKGKAIDKCGPVLSASEQSINFFKKFKNILINLANNHINDYGANGIKKTISLLSSNHLDYVGVSIGDLNNCRYKIIEKSGYSIGIYTLAEREFNVPNNKNIHISIYDSINSIFEIMELKQKCDYVIMLYHGGREYYQYPSPRLQKICRGFARAGADCIICQHSHCVGSMEHYDNSTIIYGQGNFIFDYHSGDLRSQKNKRMWNDGILLEIDLQGNPKIDMIPIKKNNYSIQEDGTDNIINAFHERSEKIKISGFIEKEWEKYCLIQRNSLSFVLDNIEKRKLYRIFCLLFERKDTKKDRILLQYNYLVCESHFELVCSLYKKYLQKEILGGME